MKELMSVFVVLAVMLVTTQQVTASNYDETMSLLSTPEHQKMAIEADAGDVKALLFKGEFFLQRGNPIMAIGYLQRAAKKGSVKAQEKLEDAYKKIDEEGRFLQNFLGNDFWFGTELIEQDRREAVKWFKKAAEQGSAMSSEFIALAYWHGLGGLPKNKTLAIKWLEKASDQGNSNAMKTLEVIKSVEDLESITWGRAF